MAIDVRPNLLDRAVAWFSPRAGAERLAGRAAISASTSMFGTGGYRGGQGDRQKRRGFFARGRSANADMIPGSDRLRAEQRDAAMNAPIAVAALNRMVTFTIGTGLMAIPAIDGEALGLTPEEVDAWQRRLAIDFDAYMASKDVDAERKSTGYGLQAVAYRGTITSGDMIKLRVMPEDQPGRVHATAWKLIEADRLCNPPTVADGAIDPTTGRQIAGGVETDEWGAPVAYHILKQHPGDLMLRLDDGLIPERIEAWDRKLALPRVVHVFKRERPEQDRGVGMLATIIEPLKMISDASDAELYATVMSAMIAVVYKSRGAQPMPEPDYGEGEGGVSVEGGEPYAAAPEPSQYRFEAGSIMEIDSDSDVEIKSPGRPNSAFDPFFQAIVRQIGAALGIPAGALMLMFNSSYTASKAELEALYMQVRADRAWFASDDCALTYLCFVAEQVVLGHYVMPGFFSDLRVRAAWLGANWRGDGKISLNPLQEAKGFEVQEAHGWRTGEDITAELTGGSFRENIRRRGAEHRAWVAEGLPVPTTAGAAKAPAGGKPDNEPASDEAPADKQENQDA
ncbi:lambda family phage portal protein [Sphingomonas sp. SORGH_AS802]|uniref:phage portal protein n=1 Tax=Sphingomonas sp. SORGH_AS_0802 TaxID=3041800 RepID=UPI0028614334|nr:phage portal protein [Sphingomonas sp. SORGH_AS_0802]MDR6136185.1 lambda family phage portal protein [Sphingomonas sp. SORGH_AS_0802]